MNMQKIASFTVDHTKLKPGMYTSRVDGDVVTYDLRMRRPNCGDYLSNGVLHTFEHLFATYVRNTEYSDRILYVGPMGCRTGFYLVVRDTISPTQAIELMRKTCAFIAAFEGEIPGATEVECGNYREQDLAGARIEAARYGEVLRGWTPAQLTYEA